MRGIKRKVIGLIMVIIIVISTLPLKVLGNSKDELINFKRITTADGLSQTTVEYMHQDKQGYIWIGTEEFHRLTLEQAAYKLRILGHERRVGMYIR